MKKKLLVAVLSVLCFMGTVLAQGTFQRQTPEERTKAIMQKLGPLKLDSSQVIKTNTVFADFYTAQQKAMQEMQASGSMDREAMKAKRDELAKARNAKLKTIFSAEQFKKWEEEIRPVMMKQRQQ